MFQPTWHVWLVCQVWHFQTEGVWLCLEDFQHFVLLQATAYGCYLDSKRKIEILHTHKIRKIYKIWLFTCSLGLPASIFLKMKLNNALNVNPHELNIYRGHKYVGKLFLKCKINPSWVYYTEKNNREFIIQKKVQICMAECVLIKLLKALHCLAQLLKHNT